MGSTFNITLTSNFDKGRILGKLVNNVWLENEPQGYRLGKETCFNTNFFILSSPS